MEIERLAPREREVAELVYEMGEASAIDVERALKDPLSNSAIRSMLRRLEAKGIVRRRKFGNKFYYAPATSERASREAALKRVSRDHFGGSLAAAAAALLDLARQDPPSASFHPRSRSPFRFDRRSAAARRASSG